MAENYQKNNGKSSKISDLSSKIREAENDLSISRGIRLRNNNSVNYSKSINGFTFEESGQDLKEVSELNTLRLKQIETAQRLKETLRRNVDLMTELQKARGIVRSLEKKLSVLERAEGVNLLQGVSKDTNLQCSHCPKQQEEINKLKLHIIEMNDTFQKRWDETQRELLQAKQSLSDVSSKLLEPVNNNYQTNINQEVDQPQNLNKDELDGLMENLNFNIRMQDRFKNNHSDRQNGSETQSPSTYRLSRPTSSNFSNDLSIHQSLNTCSRINSGISNSRYNDYSRYSEVPKENFSNTNLRDQFFNRDQKSSQNIVIKYSRPQSEHLIKHSVPETTRTTLNDYKLNSGFYQSNNRANCDPFKRIHSIDSITINPGLGIQANSFPPGLNYNNSHRKYDLYSRDSFSNTPANPTVYPNNYPSSLLSSLNKIQTPNSSFVSGTDIINPVKMTNLTLPGSNNTSFDSQHFDNNSLTPTQLECENPTEIINNSYLATELNSIQGTMSPSLSKAIIDSSKDQAVGNYFISSKSENQNEHPPSPATKDSLNEAEIDQNTYGNIRKTLEELKKTQDQRVQQLKDDREKLLRAVLSDLQEMKDFKTNFNNIKENQEKMIKTASKGLFSLEDSVKYDNI